MCVRFAARRWRGGGHRWSSASTLPGSSSRTVWYSASAFARSHRRSQWISPAAQTACRESRCGARTLRRTYPAAASSRRVLGGGLRVHGWGAGERAGQTEHRDGVEVRWAVAALTSQLPLEAAHHLRTKDPRAQPASPPPPCVQGVRVRAPRRARRRSSSKEVFEGGVHDDGSREPVTRAGYDDGSRGAVTRAGYDDGSRGAVTWGAQQEGRRYLLEKILGRLPGLEAERDPECGGGGTQPPCSRDSQQDSMPSALVRERGAL
jgi:hypothetical protein